MSCSFSSWSAKGLVGGRRHALEVRHLETRASPAYFTRVRHSSIHPSVHPRGRRRRAALLEPLDLELAEAHADVPALAVAGDGERHVTLGDHGGLTGLDQAGRALSSGIA